MMFSQIAAACLLIAVIHCLKYTLHFMRLALIDCIHFVPLHTRWPLIVFIRVLRDLQAALYIGHKLSVCILVIHACVEVIRFQMNLTEVISYAMDNKAVYVYTIFRRLAEWMPVIGRCMAWTLILVLECMSSALRLLLQ